MGDSWVELELDEVKAVGLGLDEMKARGRSDGEELDDLGLDLMWKDPGLRPVARTRTKTGMT